MNDKTEQGPVFHDTPAEKKLFLLFESVISKLSNLSEEEFQAMELFADLSLGGAQ